jgi:hypothetical protein
MGPPRGNPASGANSSVAHDNFRMDVERQAGSCGIREDCARRELQT